MVDWSNPEVRKRALGLNNQGFGVLEGARTDANGNTAARIEIHNQSTTGVNGQTLPADSIELVGSHVEVSELGGGTAQDASFSASNLSVSDANPVLNTNVDISADITNTGGDQGTQFVPLLENDQVVDRKELTIGANSTKSVTFARSYSIFESVTVQILDSGTKDIKPIGISL
jgi:hypothetical protein